MLARAVLALVAFVFVSACGARDTVHAQPARLVVLYASGYEARGPTWSPDGRLIAFVNRTRGGYFLALVDARTGKPVGPSTGRGFDHANPNWDRNGVYIPTS